LTHQYPAVATAIAANETTTLRKARKVKIETCERLAATPRRLSLLAEGSPNTALRKAPIENTKANVPDKIRLSTEQIKRMTTKVLAPLLDLLAVPASVEKDNCLAISDPDVEFFFELSKYIPTS